MADYGTFETTRQSSQPLEGYQFFWGNDSASGTSATPGTPGPGATFGSTLPSCDGTAAPTSTVVENWTGGNDTDINGRSLVTGPGTWVSEVGGSGTMDIVSGQVQKSVGGFPVYRVSGHGLGNDQSVTVTGKFTANPTNGNAAFFTVIARHATGADKGYTLHCNLERSGGGTLSTRILLSVWNDPVYTDLQSYTTTAVTLDTLHTIRLDVVGDKLYGYFDDDLVVYATNSDLTTGDPGAYMGATAGTPIITRWEAAVAVDAGDDEEVAAYGIDTFDGSNDTEINGREFDGGGDSCLAQAPRTKVLARPEVHGHIVGNTLQVTERVDASPLNWAHYVSTDLAGIGNDYRIESTWNLTSMPTSAITSPDFAWASLLARHSATTESGYEFIAQVVPSAAHGGSGLGGMVFSIDRIVAESYTTLVEFEVLTGEIALGAHSIAIHVSGNRICGFHDGELVVVAVDPLNLYPTGYPGFCLCGSEITLTSWGTYATTASQPCGTGSGSSGEALLTLNYTSADVEWTYEGDLYTPFICRRTAFVSGNGERTASEIEIRIPFDHEVAELAKTGVPRGPIGVNVIRVDRQDLTDGSAAILLQGQITRSRTEGRWCFLTLGNAGTLLDRKLPRMLTQRTCPHVLYGPFCQKDETAFTFTGLTVTSIAGRRITVDGASAAGGTDLTYFQEGVVQTDDGMSEFIEAQDGDILTLKEFLTGLEEGDTVTLIAGCDHTAMTCDTRFVNIAHFGGETGIPDRNPMTGGGLT